MHVFVWFIKLTANEKSWRERETEQRPSQPVANYAEVWVGGENLHRAHVLPVSAAAAHHVNISSGLIVVFTGLVCVYFKLSAPFKMCICVWRAGPECITQCWQPGSVGWCAVSLLSPPYRLASAAVTDYSRYRPLPCPLPVWSSLSWTQRLDISTFYNIYLQLLSLRFWCPWLLSDSCACSTENQNLLNLLNKTLSLSLYVCLCPELDNPEARVTEIHALVHRLPEKNRQMLELLMKHLAK